MYRGKKFKRGGRCVGAAWGPVGQKNPQKRPKNEVFEVKVFLKKRQI